MDISASLTKAQFATSGHKPTLVTDANAKQMNQAQVRKAAEDVEAFFISMVYETMFSGIKADGLFGGGQGEKIFRSMMIQEYGKATAKAGGFGIANSVQREILQLQEIQ
ncbi:MAG: chemotactic signal-response protein chel [Rhodospirillaceae bacterium]|nr:chemotactic signal-response protein chel [Rhodospirillaceae bacterium]|tara:strand:- start:222 stop:548 length:327 start_codon:yes stop_codon:yes gene_type:complete